MKKLIIKLLRDIRKSKGQFIAICLIILTGIFFHTGASMMAESLSVYSNEYFEEYNLADLSVYYSHITYDDIMALNPIEGVNALEGRFTFECNQTLSSTTTVLTVHSIPKNNSINKPTILEGTLPMTKEEIIIDSRYAKANDIQVGDTFKIYYNQNEFNFVVSGLCENVEHAFYVNNSPLMMPDHEKYGIAYISEENLQEINGDGTYNEMLVDINSNTDVVEVGKDIEKKSEKLSYLYEMKKEKTDNYTQIYNNMIVNRMMSFFLPITLFLVAGVILLLSMSRIIDADRQQIGIMKSLGVSNNKIRAQYILYALMAGFIGTVGGIVLGYPIYRIMAIAQTEMSYSFPDFYITMNWNSIILFSILAILCCILATYISCRSIFKESAAQAMRPKSPKIVKNIFIEKYSFIWKKIAANKKVILRNIFQSKMRTICTSFGIIACVILLIISFGFNYSLESMASHLLKNINKYDIKVEYKTVLDTDTLVLSDAIEQYHSILEIPVQFKVTEEKDTTLVVMQKDSDLICFYDVNNNRIELDNNGVIISKSYADAYNLKVGDTISLRFVSPQYDGKIMNAKIEKISLQYNYQAIYCTPAYLESFGVNYEPMIILATVINDAEIARVSEELADDKQVANIILKSDMEDSINESLEQNLLTVMMFIACAIILASVAIYIISSINIFERRRELATMKVLGYNRKKIHGIIFTENIFITVFSMIIALPLGLYFYELVFAKTFSTVDQVVPGKLDMNSIILTIVVTILATAITNWILRKKIDKINIIETLKSVE